jgi:predicted DsbA family dithiol-disulfide isomerase
MGVDIRMPSVSPQPYTRLAFEGLELAKDHGKANTYHSGVMRAFFQRNENIGEAGVLTEVAAVAGVPAAEFRRALDERTYAARVEDLLRYANETVRVTAVPLFLIGSMRLTGLQSPQTLERALESTMASQG